MVIGSAGMHCTGTIVSDRHVLTAAHCFANIQPRYENRPRGQRVYVSSRVNGTYDKDLKFLESGFLDKQPNFTVHPKYDFAVDYMYGFPGYDVAIVELSKRITFSDHDQPICIVDSFRENIGETAYVVGYGHESVNETSESVPFWNVTYNAADGNLHENLIQFRTVDRCGSIKVPIGTTMIRHPERAICAVGNKRVIAKGDSGGPLMINRKGVWYQVGTTSIGALIDDDNGQTKWFSMYSRLSRSCDWIEKVTSGEVKCAPMEG